ncbi:MAG: serine hydrolase [Candidatus Pedobacter colombiensis]|uniref:Serine hydrolase n=1 Tax=Candidatus Pedobacter colombiensis TaxID=3121371 RepID=A0AAJ6B905_9SPHI|nr:serine hydrolase domain-containing protein [Pedobacter sp.]WEK21424.1 MAG: serine hydrolase [Pedobacter sp.]
MNKILCWQLVLSFCVLTVYGQVKTRVSLAKDVNNIFEKWNKNESPGYAIGIVKGDKMIFSANYGLANLDYNLPITSSSAFDIASVSKQFTAACIALLIMDKKIDLETPAERFIPELAKYNDTIRIKHLLYNTSGIPDYPGLQRKNGLSWVTFNYFTIDECIRTSLANDTLSFKSGMKWDYCNVNFMLLTKIVEKVSGMPFSEFARLKLFEPLGMKHTLVNDDNTEIIPNRVTPYNPRNKAYVDAYNKEGIHVNQGSGWLQHPRNSPHYGGSGVVTSVNDFALWEVNFSTRKFGGNEFYDLMHLKLNFPHGRNNQAFGLYTEKYNGRTFWAWDGGDFGISSQAMYFPDKKIAIMVLSNMGNGNAAEKTIEIADVLIKTGLL